MTRLALLIPFLLAGCASTYTADSCPAVDWSGEGFEAGVAGKPLGATPEAARKCRDFGVVMDRLAYENGWREGVREYCAPDALFAVALSREPEMGVCPAPSFEVEDLLSVAAGHRLSLSRLAEAEDEVEKAFRDIESREERVRDTRADINDLRVQLESAEGPQAAEIRNAIEKYRDRIAKDRRRIDRAQDRLARAESALRVATPVADDSTANVERILRSLR